MDDKRERQKTWHVLTEQAWVRGVGIDFLLQSCCCWCYVIQPVHYVLHECVVGCPIPSSMYEHVPIYHLIVLDCTPSYTLCALTYHHRVRCSSGLKQLAKHHQHVTYTPCKAPKKAVEGATALLLSRFLLFLSTRVTMSLLRCMLNCAKYPSLCSSNPCRGTT